MDIVKVYKCDQCKRLSQRPLSTIVSKKFRYMSLCPFCLDDFYKKQVKDLNIARDDKLLKDLGWDRLDAKSYLSSKFSSK